MSFRVHPHFEEAQAYLRALMRSQAMRRAMFWLLPYIGVLVGLDVAAHYGAITNAPLPAQFFLSQDMSFGEYLEYSFTIAIAAMMALVWRRTRAAADLANALLFVWLTLDNWLELHELIGKLFETAFPFGRWGTVEPHDFGEALALVTIGLVWLSGLAFSLRSADARAVLRSLALAACVGSAAVFAVVVDLLVVANEGSAVLHEFLTWLEDGGEFAAIAASFFITVAIFDVERARLSRGKAHSP